MKEIYSGRRYLEAKGELREYKGPSRKI